MTVTLLAIGMAGAQSGKAAGQMREPAPENSIRLTEAADSGAQPVSRPKSFDPAAMDKTVNPCEDFYEYSCGAWRKNNPLPSDQSRWGRFNELAEYNRQILHEILEKNAANNPGRNAAAQKSGDFYQSCMDEKTIDAKGSAPLKPELDRIAGISTKDQLIEAISHLHALGVNVLFGFGAQPDLHDASTIVANVSQGGLGLPDRDYYLKGDPKSQETRQKYQAHITNMFKLLGDSDASAGQEAQAVMEIETKLADAAFERVKMRDPRNRDHKMPVEKLAELAPSFQFKRFFAGTGAPAFSELNVVPPDFFAKVNGTIDSVPLAAWKSYLRWHVLSGSANLLSKPFVDESFSFFGKYLNGIKEMQPRWKRCVQLTDMQLGEALGQPYVHETFGADGKARMLKMVDALETSLAADIKDLPWMTAETRKQAAVKLSAITNKIGYPDTWKDYKTVTIARGDLAGNFRQVRSYEVHRTYSKIGKPLDKKEWGMSPPTVNAYYSPSNNDINFPAGILQPPFFDQAADDAVNFGGIGVVIGHELTHGFDDQGSKFDAQGNLRNWWTDSDRSEFDKRTGCVADEYSGFVAVEDVHLDGKLTLGENTADNGGLRIALMALRKAMAEDEAKGAANKATSAKKDGYTAEQRFFLSFAQIWCQNSTPENSRLLAKTDPHSPGQYRVNGTLQNSEDFAKVFGCKAGQKMVSANACRVW
ncbi:MAG TPA: M13 family metallopeptidase [Candidatus Saccharimonadales bacterium]|nr:M13 family metallopeptidase [Candidatus Saccharimonadales bacterium]